MSDAPPAVQIPLPAAETSTPPPPAPARTADAGPTTAGKYERAKVWLSDVFVFPKGIEESEAVRLARLQHRQNVCSLCVAIAAFVLPILAALVIYDWGVLAIRRDVSQMNDRVVRVERSVKAREFIVSEPSPDAEVELTGFVSGYTPFPQQNHYLVVTPVKTGDDYVQAGRVDVSSSGSWTGNARFGEPAVGAGERYTVRCLSTAEVLEPGPLPPLPDDAVFSEAVTVIRKR